MTEPIELLPTKKSKEKKIGALFVTKSNWKPNVEKKNPGSREAVKFMCRNSGSVLYTV